MKYLIQNQCPDFVAPALLPGGTIHDAFRLSEFLAGDYGVIFFYPLDFNYISWTELLSVQKRLSAFSALNAKIVAISGDSPLAHRAWQSQSDGAVGTLGFPLVSDMTRNVARLFDVLVADAMPEAATIIVDRENKVIFQLRHDTAVGRNIDRILEAIKIFQDSTAAPTSPVEQILLVEQNAAKFYALGYNIVAQSVDTALDHPQWNRLPRDDEGNIKLSFPFLDCQHEWPKKSGMTIAVREGLRFHSTGLLIPDGQLLFEHHADRQIPRDFSEMLRITDAVKKNLADGTVIPWETP
jgi:peroxiredoxin (alkyl hydroperoxide reductase subunit C)